MSETTEIKSIEEIAREEDGDLLKLVFRTDGTLTLAGADILKFGEAVRRSDRQHWLEVAEREIDLLASVYARHGKNASLSACEEVLDAIKLALTAQEKKD